MEDLLEGAGQAESAIRHALGRIRDDERFAHRLGIGTRTYELLIEALASIEGRPVAEVREDYRSPEPHG